MEDRLSTPEGVSDRVVLPRGRDDGSGYLLRASRRRQQQTEVEWDGYLSRSEQSGFSKQVSGPRLRHGPRFRFPHAFVQHLQAPRTDEAHRVCAGQGWRHYAHVGPLHDQAGSLDYLRSGDRRFVSEEVATIQPENQQGIPSTL